MTRIAAAAAGCLVAAGLLGAVLLVPATLQAQSLAGALEWLPPGSLSATALSIRSAENLAGGTAQNFYTEFGRLAFRSPDILGGTARKAGISCQACHSNGHANTAFFVPGLSDRPGRIDVTHAFWNLRGEDHRDNPLTIPSLRGVAAKERLGQDRHAVSLREFTRRVIVVEFAGEEPSPLLLDGLTAYLEKLRPGTAELHAVSLSEDLADIARYLKTLAVPLAEEDVVVTAQIVQMIRGQLGFIHERFADETLRGSRAALESWSRQLAQIASHAEAGEWPAARQTLANLRGATERPPAAFVAEAPLSLYDPERLQAWLSMPVR